MAELETFWTRIPVAEHKAWSQRAQHYLIDGSPVWHIFRACPALAEDAAASSSQTDLPTDQVTGRLCSCSPAAPPLEYRAHRCCAAE